MNFGEHGVFFYIYTCSVIGSASGFTRTTITKEKRFSIVREDDYGQNELHPAGKSKAYPIDQEYINFEVDEEIENTITFSLYDFDEHAESKFSEMVITALGRKYFKAIRNKEQ